MNQLQDELSIILNEYEYLKAYDRISYDNISQMQSQLLISFVKQCRPNSILEIGTSNGYSLFSMLRGIITLHSLENLTIVAVEINSERFERVKQLKERLNLFNQLHCIEADIFLTTTQKEIVRISTSFDFIFVDCNQDRYLELFNMLLEQKLVHNKSTICFENILSHTHAYDFYQNLKKNDSFEVIEFPLHNGFIIVRFRDNHK